MIYPLVVWGIGQVAFNKQANGSLITNTQGQVIGSELIGQQFTSPNIFTDGPAWSAIMPPGSGASNLGPTNPQLIEGNGSDSDRSRRGNPSSRWHAGCREHRIRYYVPGSYLGVKNYADQFRQENGLAADASARRYCDGQWQRP